MGRPPKGAVPSVCSTRPCGARALGLKAQDQAPQSLYARGLEAAAHLGAPRGPRAEKTLEPYSSWARVVSPPGRGVRGPLTGAPFQYSDPGPCRAQGPLQPPTLLRAHRVRRGPAELGPPSVRLVP